MKSSFSRSIRYLLLLLVFACCHRANATHIVGGDLGYQYLGETAPGTGEYRYKLILRLFVNCGPSSSYPSVIDILGSESTGLPVGVYPDDPANPNANKQLMQTAYLYVTSYGVITPNLPAGCSRCSAPVALAKPGWPSAWANSPWRSRRRFPTASSLFHSTGWPVASW